MSKHGHEPRSYISLLSDFRLFDPSVPWRKMSNQVAKLEMAYGEFIPFFGSSGASLHPGQTLVNDSGGVRLSNPTNTFGEAVGTGVAIPPDPYTIMLSEAQDAVSSAAYDYASKHAPELID